MAPLARPLRAPRWPLYLGLYLLALALRAWVSHRTASIYPDGVVDLETGHVAVREI